MSEIKSKLGEVLYERRMTQKELAEAVERKFGTKIVKQSVISDIVNNIRSTINRKHLGMIAATLDISDMNELLYCENTARDSSVGEEEG